MQARSGRIKAIFPVNTGSAAGIRKKTGQGKYSQIAVDNIQPSSYHFLGKHMAACTDTGQDKQAGKKEIFFKKYIQRTAVLKRCTERRRCRERYRIPFWGTASP